VIIEKSSVKIFSSNLLKNIIENVMGLMGIALVLMETIMVSTDI